MNQPSGVHPPVSMSWWRLFVLTPLARLRFVFILALIGLTLAKWDTLLALWEKWSWSKPVSEAIASGFEYFCPMHPTFSTDKKGEKCPICFMGLSKRKKGPDTADILPPGTVNRVQLTPYRMILAGIKTLPVSFVPLVKELSTVGTVEFDEREQKHVASRVKGRIEKLLVNQTGQMVHMGDDLAVIYSPDLVVTVQNLLDARRSNNLVLEKISRERLELWGVGKEEIDNILRTGVAVKNLTIRSPITGHVLKKYPKEGQYVDEGSPLYDVVNLEKVWILAHIYEDDLGFFPALHKQGLGKPALEIAWGVSATTRAYPEEKFKGTLTFIYPHVDQESRTLSVRFEMANPGNRLHPGMATQVRLTTDAVGLLNFKGPEGKHLFPFVVKGGKVLAIPEDSVIDTGDRKVVYRQESPGVFQGTTVELGPRMKMPDGHFAFPVYAGLKEGDEVVTQGAFLIDAETRLNPSVGSIYFGSTGAKDPVRNIRPTTPSDEAATIASNVAKLSPPDKSLALAQKLCVVQEKTPLGSMGVPIKLQLEGQTVFVCCDSCVESAKSNPAKTLKRLKDLKSAQTNGKSKEGTSP